MTRPEPPGGEPYPTLEELERLVQFQHPRKFLAALPGARKIDHALSARLLGTDPATYTEIRGRFASSVARAARALLDDHRFAEQVDGLPFAPGDTVVALGDSLTDDFQSWWRSCAMCSACAAAVTASAWSTRACPARPRPMSASGCPPSSPTSPTG